VKRETVKGSARSTKYDWRFDKGENCVLWIPKLKSTDEGEYGLEKGGK